jgi:hypothetical protein
MIVTLLSNSNLLPIVQYYVLVLHYVAAQASRWCWGGDPLVLATRL